MSEQKHEHIFHKANLKHRDGTPIPGGRRCSCGLEVVGDGPLTLSANFIRSSREINQSIAKSFENMAKQMNKVNKRRFPD